MTIPLQITWVVSDGIPGAGMFARDCMQGLQAMEAYLRSLGVPELREGITVYVLSDLDELDEAYAAAAGHRMSDTRERWNSVSGSAASRQIFLNLAVGHFDNTRWGQLQMMKVAAHELYHIYQAKLSGLDFASPVNKVPGTGPHWLTEGSARFSEYRALLRAGILPCDMERNSGIPGWIARQCEYMAKPLRQMETRNGLDEAGSSYNFALLAAEALASLVGEKALMRYYAFQAETTWRQAFKLAFGITVEGFYNLFEDYHASGFPQVEIPGNNGSTN